MHATASLTEGYAGSGGAAGPDGRPVIKQIAQVLPVSPAPEILAENLGALFAADITLARALDAIPDADLPPLLRTRTGLFTAAIPDPTNPAGAPLYLHSRHDPKDEARRLIDSVQFRDRVCFAIHGMGLGYHVAELIERGGTDTFIILFENDLRILRRALECVDVARAIRIKQLCFVTQPEKVQLFSAIGTRTILLSMGTSSVSHAPSLRLQPEFHKACTAMLTDYAGFSRTSLNTLILNGRKTAENISKNIRWYAAAGGLTRLHKKYDKQPAIIVSAGPSLRKNQHLLAQAKGKAVLVAVQTMLKPMVQMGVEPDFVTSLDHHEISSRFFEGLPPSLQVELIAEPKVSHVVMERHPGPVSVVGSDYADSLLREMNLPRPRLMSGATVAHLAYYLARYLGCDPILFVGQDLGFSDGLCYSPGTSYDDVWRPELSRFCSMEMKQWEQIVRERPILRRIPDVHGGAMYTEERLFTYLQQFERDFGQATEKVIDCTEGGALKRGATPMPLAQALAKYCTKPLNPLNHDLHLGRDFSRMSEVADCLKLRREEARSIHEIADGTLPLLEEIRAHIDDQRRVNHAIARIDLLRARMNDLGRTYDLVTQLTQKSELQRFESDLKISSDKNLDPFEKQRRQVTRDIENCRAIISASKEFEALMQDVIAALPPATTKEAA